MQIGKWVPIDKRLAKFLPKNRKYEELEAVFSLSIDYDNQNEVTVSGYASLWGWSRTKVNSFLDEIGVEIIYPDDTNKNQKQKGQIKKQKEDRKETEKRQIRFIDSKWLEDSKNRKKTGKKQEKNRSKNTTNDPIINPNPEPIIKDTLKPENVTDQTWSDFLAHRKNKKAIVTEGVIKGFKKQADQIGWTLEQAFRESIDRGWAGFKAEWMKNKTQTNSKEINPHEPTKMTTRELIERGMPNNSQSDKPQLPEAGWNLETQ